MKKILFSIVVGLVLASPVHAQVASSTPLSTEELREQLVAMINDMQKTLLGLIAQLNEAIANQQTNMELVQTEVVKQSAQVEEMTPKEHLTVTTENGRYKFVTDMNVELKELVIRKKSGATHYGISYKTPKHDETTQMTSYWGMSCKMYEDYPTKVPKTCAENPDATFFKSLQIKNTNPGFIDSYFDIVLHTGTTLFGYTDDFDIISINGKLVADYE